MIVLQGIGRGKTMTCVQPIYCIYDYVEACIVLVILILSEAFANSEANGERGHRREAVYNLLRKLLQ